MQAPSLSQACFLCYEIDRALENAETVAVHCKAGLGRTGTVLALYWLWLWGGQISAAAAIEHVRYRCAAMIQSVEQENFLENFALQVEALQSGHNGRRYEV
jgi:atypical dual specificity phosphatase